MTNTKTLKKWTIKKALKKSRLGIHKCVFFIPVLADLHCREGAASWWCWGKEGRGGLAQISTFCWRSSGSWSTMTPWSGPATTSTSTPRWPVQDRLLIIIIFQECLVQNGVLNRAVSEAAGKVSIGRYLTVSVLWRKEGYTVKYSLGPREILRPELEEFIFRISVVAGPIFSSIRPAQLAVY